jgi:hypothetical protein
VSQTNKIDGLYAIYCLSVGVVNEYIIDIQVVNGPTSRGSQSQNGVDGSRLHH